MDITRFALALIERHADLLGAHPDLLSDIAARYAEDIVGTAELVTALFENRAGFRTQVPGINGSIRLGDPRLRAIYPEERRRALTKRLLGYNDELSVLLPKMLELVLKRELAQVELDEERQRDREFEDAAHARDELGVYVEVVDTIDRLYHSYGCTRRDYACLSDEQIRDIAAIINRQAPEDLAIKPRRSRQGRSDV